MFEKRSQSGPDGFSGYAIFWHMRMTIFDGNSVLFGLRLAPPTKNAATKFLQLYEYKQDAMVVLKWEPSSSTLVSYMLLPKAKHDFSGRHFSLNRKLKGAP
jgi:hypothetical protein